MSSKIATSRSSRKHTWNARFGQVDARLEQLLNNQRALGVALNFMAQQSGELDAQQQMIYSALLKMAEASGVDLSVEAVEGEVIDVAPEDVTVEESVRPEIPPQGQATAPTAQV